MHEQLLWSIGSSDGRSPELVDTHKQPNLLDGVVWRVGASEPQKWPAFHPSEADPDAGYRPHPYTVVFTVDGAPSGSYVLRIEHLAIAPRLAHLMVELNGTAGLAYLRPAPSQSGEIRVHSGLHTTIYVEGTTEVVIPAALLCAGENRLVLTAFDGGEVLRVDRVEAIKRLDRMANSAGFLYQRLSFWRRPEPVPVTVLTAVLEPTVIYVRGEADTLVERCHAFLELSGPADGSSLTLELREGERRETVALQVPTVAFGHQRVAFDLFDGTGEVAYHLEGTLGGQALDQRGTLKRKRKWKIYVAPHAHTDVGYTHRQWEVAERQSRNVDAAVALLDRFAFHLDSAWALENYQQTRSEEQVKRLREALLSGKLGVSATYVDLLTHTAGLEDLIRNCTVAQSLLERAGKRSDFATVVDVASITSAFPDVLAGAEVRYLLHADNQDRGPFRLNGGLHRASPFWWEGKGGAKVRVWLAKMYCELRKVCGSPPMPTSAARGIELWLAEYERPDYLPDAVLLYGQEADNTDLDPQPAEFVRTWNESVAYPQLVPCAVSEFFRYVEEGWGETFATLHGDGGAYWEDGVSASLMSAIQARQAQAALPAAERLEALAAIHQRSARFPTEHYQAAWREVLQWDEHTFSAFLSGPEPRALLQADQWAVKEGFARQSRHWANRLLLAAATRHSLCWNNDGREVVVYNPHSWPVSGLVVVEIEPNEVAVRVDSKERAPMRVLQRLASQMTVELWVDALPALSYRRFVLQRQETPADARHEALKTYGPLVAENAHYRLTLDPERGGLSSLFDKALGRELVDPKDPYAFGQLLYARGGEGTRLVSNRADLPEVPPRVLADFACQGAALERFDHGTCLRVHGVAPCGELEIAWTLHDRAKRVDVRYRYRKEPKLSKEAVYVAFPSSLSGARVLSDAHLGWVDWDMDELPGGCKEWLPLQTAIAVRGDGADLLVCSPDVPLFCVGTLVEGRWPKTKDLTGGRVFSYVLNNYWDTNYLASQGGDLEFGYHLTSAASISPADAYRRGWEARQALYCHRMSFQDFREVEPPYPSPSGGALAQVDSDGVVLTALHPAKDSRAWLARFQEIAGTRSRLKLAFPNRPIAKAFETNLLEREPSELPVSADGALEIDLDAWKLMTVRFELAR